MVEIVVEKTLMDHLNNHEWKMHCKNIKCYNDQIWNRDFIVPLGGMAHFFRGRGWQVGAALVEMVCERKCGRKVALVEGKIEAGQRGGAEIQQQGGSALGWALSQSPASMVPLRIRGSDGS